jgi:glycosyltransferase involved in cell wall biosynthesis
MDLQNQRPSGPGLSDARDTDARDIHGSPDPKHTQGTNGHTLEQLASENEILRRALDDVRFSASFQITSRVVWPISKRLPRFVRWPLKVAASRARARLHRAAPPQRISPDPLGGQTWSLDYDLSQPLDVAKGNVLFLKGSCYDSQHEIRELSLVVDGRAERIAHHSLCDPRSLELIKKGRDAAGQSLTSAFWTTVKFNPADTDRKVTLGLRATLDNGETSEVELGVLCLQAGLPIGETANPKRTEHGSSPLVAICMATYNPQDDLLTRQIDSLITQTHRDWVCIINDDCSDTAAYEQIKKIAAQDSRVRVFRNQTRLGFYRNFERCLNLVPDDVEFIAFCDQDDEWYPDKLEACLAAFDRDTYLVFSDMKVVSRDGEVLSDTYWSRRQNQYSDLGALLFANTITGAASLFRRELLAGMLPFPDVPGQMFHDQWSGCVALTKGRIKFVDRPLYSYCQHDRNVYGHATPASVRFKEICRDVIQLRSAAAAAKLDFRNSLVHVPQTFFDSVVRISLLAKTLKQRHPDAPKHKRKILNRLARMERSLLPLVHEAFRIRLKRLPTLGLELVSVRAILSMRLLTNYCRRYRKHIVAELVGADSTHALTKLDVTPAIDFIPQKIAPLNLRIARNAKRRINILVSEVKLQYLFAGYLCVFNLALQLKRAGYDVRIVLVDRCDFNPPQWNRELAAYEGLADLFDQVEAVYLFDRSNPLMVSTRDAFIATSWWTAHVAHHATQELKQHGFVYLVQEYEPLFYPAGSFLALAEQAYTFPHRAIFSTELLRDYFQGNNIGAFSHKGFRRPPIVIQNAANRFALNEQTMRQRKKRRFLFYARPDQATMARNAFELGVLALRETIKEGHFKSNAWEFHGLGAVGDYQDVPLSKTDSLAMRPKLSLNEFVQILPTYDAGMSLMLSPHPSLMPIDMAAAGLMTVTNTYATKTSERLAEISPNLIAAPPTLEGLKQGLIVALSRVSDFERRIAGANLNWSRSWSETFNPEIMTALKGYLDD